MSKMSELHYNISQREQEDDDKIEYDMKYPYQSKYTITYKNWYKKYCEGRKK